MAMTDAHKSALEQGRRESRAITAYLKALGTQKPGRRISKDGLQKRLDKVNEKLGIAENPLERVDLLQSKLDIEKAIRDTESTQDFAALESGFIENVASYSDRKGVSYRAWREYGVPASVLKAGGVKETRRR